MNVAIVNPFDPLPGEDFRPGRYAFLCRALVGRGHRVCWYSSNFWHEFKRFRDEGAIRQAAREAGYDVRLAPALGYTRNMSLRRLRDHARVASAMQSLWRDQADRPDVIVVSLPPPVLGRAASEWADRTGAKLVVDTQDLWPETFRRFWPKGLGWLNGLAFAGVARDAQRAWGRADALVGVARGYVEHAQPHLAPGAPAKVLHLGVDLGAFDAGVQPMEAFGLSKPPDEKWIFLGGAIRSHIDVTGTAEMMAELQRRGRNDIRLVVVASEETTGPLRAEAERLGLRSIRFMGHMPYGQFVSLAAASDVALCPIRPAALVYLPNRVFDYFAAGAPILNTLRGELADLLAEHDAGLTCDASDPASWADAAEALIRRRRSEDDYKQRRGEWVRRFDRADIAERFVDLIESLC